MAIQTIVVDAQNSGQRLDVLLTTLMPEYTRSFWQKCCEQGLVCNATGEPLRVSKKLASGEAIVISLPDKPDFSTCDIPILYEDDDVVVMNKPSGMLTHAKGALSSECTVAEFVRPRTTDGLETNRPGIVHRLDRGTSGIIIAAKHNEAKRWLQKQFAQRKVKKTYLALIAGQPNETHAIIDAPIERNPKQPQTFRVGSAGKTAQTEYEIAEHLGGYSLLRLSPKTGRTHQLRVHLAYIHKPIIGDTLYNKTASKLGRMFLHAAELELTLPSRERKIFVAPLPPELEAYVIELRTKQNPQHS